MNIGEGTRRLAVVLGVLGCLVGAYLAFAEEKTVWEARSAAQALNERFQSVMSLKSIQQVARALADKQDPKKLFPQITGNLAWDPKEMDPDFPNPTESSSETIIVGVDGINHVNLKNGAISSVLLSPQIAKSQRFLILSLYNQKIL
jgi:hypothetical protein